MASAAAMNRCSLRSRGFTLIEVLVSLALMALIATILIAALLVGGRSWERVGRAHRQSEQVVYVERYLRHLLEHISPSNIQGLEGTEHTLRIPGPAPAARGDGLLTYEIAFSDASHALTVRALDSATEPETLIPTIEDAQFAFWDARTLPGHWTSGWDAGSGIPRLIRIEVRLGLHDTRDWPALYVEPRLDTDAACHFDTVARRCRSIG
jgi:prepilin-type N-terminal cleavage/methylation domain-containing protein